MGTQPCVLRPLAEDHVTSLVAFREAEYGKTEFARSEYIGWQLLENPAGRAIAWIALDPRDSVIGECWTLPTVFRIDGQDLVGAVGTNALVHPDYRREGLFCQLFERCTKDCHARGIEFVVVVPNSRSMRALLSRFRSHDLGRMPVLVRPVNVGRISRRFLRHQWIADLVSSASGVFVGRRTGSSDLQPREINARRVDGVTFSDACDTLWTELDGKYRCMTVRDRAHLNWRYLQLPVRDYGVALAEDSQGPTGYLITRSRVWMGLRVLFIVDFAFAEGARGLESGRALIDSLVAVADPDSTDLICAVLLERTEEFGLLRRMGFRLCPSAISPHPFHLVVHTNPGFREPLSALDLNQWFWALGDYDVI